MKFSDAWIREWVNPALSPQQLAEQLTMAGLEVDAVTPAAPVFNNVVVANVLSVEKHPEADKLNVCRVDVGQGEPLQIVCGASNVRVGIKVPAAMIGAKLPNGMEIKKAKLRGVESHGMLCSAQEIGIAEKAEGLLILVNDAPIGKNIRDYLQLDDQVIEIDFTPNRGDCLSVAGLAREISALNEAKFSPVVVNSVKPSIDETLPIKVDAKNACPRYLGRVIKGVNAKAPTPTWMVERLRRAGIRSISSLVDITNYVLIELGQPLHAFDLNKLSGGIVVRMAQPNEKIKLLDESEHQLQNDILVIADQKQAHAFAGVMGGLDSSVTDDTQNILLECAFFSPDAVRGRARRYGLQTDSSYRFERGVDFELQPRAMERATQLVLEIAGGKAGPVVDQTSREHLPKRAPIHLRAARVKRVSGMSFSDKQIENLLTRLGMQVSKSNEGWTVVPPSHRFDIAIEVDLIEEIIRINGYLNVPENIPTSTLSGTPQAEALLSVDEIRRVVLQRGYHEAVTYSFVDPAIQKMIAPNDQTITLSNPISQEMSIMRSTLWTSLLRTLTYNQSRQQDRVRLFEKGMRFWNSNNAIKQESVIAGLVYGPIHPSQWDQPERDVDFYDVKADVDAILESTGIASAFEFRAEIHPALHPGQSACIYRDGNRVGWVGILHPKLQRELELTRRTGLFELTYDQIKHGGVAKFLGVSKFPSIRRDLALVVDEKVASRQITDVIRAQGDSLLKAVEIFDLYRGKGVPDGKKSLAIALTLQDDNETLTDDKVDSLIGRVLRSLQESTGATLRE